MAYAHSNATHPSDRRSSLGIVLPLWLNLYTRDFPLARQVSSCFQQQSDLQHQTKEAALADLHTFIGNDPEWAKVLYQSAHDIATQMK